MPVLWRDLKDWLSQRRTRATYLRWHVGFLLSLVPLGILLEFIHQDWLLNTVALLACLLQLALTVQRCHDIGWTGWVAPLILVPLPGTVFWLALFFIPGTKGSNRYGADPGEFQASTAAEPTVWKQ